METFGQELRRISKLFEKHKQDDDGKKPALEVDWILMAWFEKATIFP